VLARHLSLSEGIGYAAIAALAGCAPGDRELARLADDYQQYQEWASSVVVGPRLCHGSETCCRWGVEPYGGMLYGLREGSKSCRSVGHVMYVRAWPGYQFQTPVPPPFSAHRRLTSELSECAVSSLSCAAALV
jgi:hypothetical protein